MSIINRVIFLFRDELGFGFFDDWIDRERVDSQGNSNIDARRLVTDPAGLSGTLT